MRKPRWLASLAAGALLCLATAVEARADWWIVEQPKNSGSWDVLIGVTMPLAFNSFHATIIPGSASVFEDLSNDNAAPNAVDDFRNDFTFDPAPWAQTSISNPSAGGYLDVTAAGDLRTRLLTRWHFTQDIYAGGAWHVEFFNDGTYVGFQDVRIQAVPLPPAVWAGLATLGAMGAYLVRRRRSRELLA